MSKSGKGDILIVDDQVATLKVLTTMLTEQGYRVRQAISGPLALKAVQKSPPDLILLDIVMPDMGGYEVCERLKADESTRDIPVIFISALDDVQDKVKAFAVGGVDYMSRLFQEKEVLARLETHLALRAMQKELEEKNAQLEQEIAERKRAEERLQRFADRLETLHVIDVGILSARSPEEIAQFALAGVRYMAPCRRAVIVEFDFEAQEGVLLAVDVDQETTIEKGTRVPLEPMRDIIEVLDRGQSYVMEDLLASAEKHPLAAALFAEGLRSGIIIPLMVEGTLIGSLSLHADSPGLFDREQIMIAREVADSLAVALQNARLVGALRESEERYRSLFDGVPVGLYRSTPEGQLLDINLALVEMGRFPDRQSALAANLTDRYVDPEERGRLLATIEQEGIVRDYEYQARRFDGTIIWVKDTVRVVRDANGQALYYEGSLEDITERKRAEEALMESESRYRAMFNSIPDAVILINPGDFTIIATNPMAMKQLKIEEGEVVGKTCYEATHLRSSPCKPPDHVCPIWEMMETGRSATVEHTHYDRDGNPFYVEVSASPVKDARGRIVQVVHVARDITERKQAEEMKDNLIRDVSHELRTPLAKMQMSVERLMETVESPSIDRQRLAATSAIVSVGLQRLRRTVNSILDLSSLEHGQVRYRKTKIQPENLISQVIADMQPLAGAKGLELAAELPEGLPQIEGDQEKLLRVLINLVANAVKFSDQGKIVVSAKMMKKAHEVEIAVSDSGRGIPRENLDRIFERFWQDNPSIPGAGIGLAICKTIVEAHGGKIWAESPGRGPGATVRFTLPVVDD